VIGTYLFALLALGIGLALTAVAVTLGWSEKVSTAYSRKLRARWPHRFGVDQRDPFRLADHIRIVGALAIGGAAALVWLSQRVL
jgi:hypothetical protein